MFGQFPCTRLRRARKFKWSRNLIKENSLSINDFILAVFITEGESVELELDMIQEILLYSVDKLIIKLKNLIDFGLNAVMLFPHILKEKKSKNAEESCNPENLICKAIKEIKKHFPDLGVITDVALDPYTVDGHDGIIDENGYVVNDGTIDILCKQALNFAKAGCDIIAPSDMMDGRVGKIRQYLDQNNFHDTQIMSYAIKFASSFYEPFRSSIGSRQVKSIDKSSYQIDFSNSKEAMREIAQDIYEGADCIIIKPSMIYLDIIKEAQQTFNIPIIAYNVSGEYALLMHGVQNNLFDKKRIFYETYIAMKRAGAQMIIIYNFNIIIDIIKKFQ